MADNYPPPHHGQSVDQDQPPNQGLPSPQPGQPPSYNPYYSQQQQSYPLQPVVPGQPQQFHPQYKATGRVGKESFSTTCNNCGAVMNTEVHVDTGIVAWAAAGVLVLIGCFLGCCLIPLCMDSLKEYTHYCPQCKALVGKYRP